MQCIDSETLTSHMSFWLTPCHIYKQLVILFLFLSFSVSWRGRCVFIKPELPAWTHTGLVSPGYRGALLYMTRKGLRGISTVQRGNIWIISNQDWMSTKDKLSTEGFILGKVKLSNKKSLNWIQNYFSMIIFKCIKLCKCMWVERISTHSQLG